MSVKVTKDGTKKLFQAVNALTKKAIYVGIAEGDNSRNDGPIGNATIGYISETGSPAQNIPARPWLTPGIEEGKDAIVKQLTRAAKLALDGKNFNQALHGAGLAGQSSAQNKITTGPFVPLSPKTISARKRRGRDGEKPLIDTGEFRRSVSYVIRDNDA